MLRDDLRTLWKAPRPLHAPGRVWRDWALLAASLASVTLEVTLRDNLIWWPVAAAFAIGMSVLALWRRTHPLAMITLAFSAMIMFNIATLVATQEEQREQTGLYTSMVVLILVYALPRWGSGREIVLGGTVILAGFSLSIVTENIPISERIAGFVVLALPAVIGASVRFWATARERQLERMRSCERERLARELHDTVAHHVSAMVIRAQAGRILATTNPAAAIEALEGVEEEGARTLEEMRAMVATLREGGASAELAPQAGVADLERLLRAPAGHLRVDLGLDGELGTLPPAVDAAIYRIVQESVTNAMRHAVDATEVIVRIIGEPQRVRVAVWDDGARAGRGRDGYGLTGLRERASLLGGQLRAGPGADQGWRVEAELPLRGWGHTHLQQPPDATTPDREGRNSGGHPRTRR